MLCQINISIENVKKHGNTRYVLEGRGYYRCVKCRSERVTQHRRKVKIKLVEALGGRCINCGYNKCVGALVFHHSNANKDFGISRSGVTRSYKQALKEARKCQLLCANCHMEIHFQDGEMVSRLTVNQVF